MMCTDTGVNHFEINVLARGANYAWNLKNGEECIQQGRCDNIGEWSNNV